MCAWCSESIRDTDCGIRFPSNGVVAHAECNLRSLTGPLEHLADMCICASDHRGIMTVREDALRVWDYVMGTEGRRSADLKVQHCAIGT